MRPGPPVQPSRRRPPRRQEVPQERNRRHRLDQPQPLRSPSCGNRSRALLVLLLLASSPLVLGLAEPPGLPGAEWQQALLSGRQTYPKSTVTRAIQPRKQQNLTIGYLTAIKGGLKDRQGLAISGAFSMALDEVSLLSFFFFLFFRISTYVSYIRLNFFFLRLLTNPVRIGINRYLEND